MSRVKNEKARDVPRPDLNDIGERLTALRVQKKWSQSDIAQMCGVTQSQVSRWERLLDKPDTEAMMAISKAAGNEEDEQWWMKRSGFYKLVGTEGLEQPKRTTRKIPFLRDSAAAGTPREIDGREFQGEIEMPAQWFRPGGTLYAVQVEGDSMEPLLVTGSVAIIDTSKKDSRELVNKMVAARSDGVTVKWLREEQGVFMLVPNNVNLRNPIKILRNDGEWTLVGEVVKWIGDPQHNKET